MTEKLATVGKFVVTSEDIEQEQEGEILPEEDILNTEEAGEFLQLSVNTLKAWRVAGIGPAYARRGPGGKKALAYYSRADLEAFRESRRYTVDGSIFGKKNAAEEKSFILSGTVVGDTVTIKRFFLPGEVL